jgi:threonine/homoserine/homoserine lactone efflux protein
VLKYLIMGITLGFAAGVQPGPLVTFLISRSLNAGWRRTLPAALAPVISDAPIVVIVLLILSAIPVWMQNILHLAGGFFILYLAWGTYRSYRNYQLNPQAEGQSGKKTLLKAGLVNLLNPNPYLMWSLVMGPLVLLGWRESPRHGVSLLSGFYLTIVLTLAGIVLLFATLRNLGNKVIRVLIGISALALAGFGLFQIWLGAKNW